MLGKLFARWGAGDRRKIEPKSPLEREIESWKVAIAKAGGNDTEFVVGKAIDLTDSAFHELSGGLKLRAGQAMGVAELRAGCNVGIGEGEGKTIIIATTVCRNFVLFAKDCFQEIIVDSDGAAAHYLSSTFGTLNKTYGDFFRAFGLNLIDPASFLNSPKDERWDQLRHRQTSDVIVMTLQTRSRLLSCGDQRVAKGLAKSNAIFFDDVPVDPISIKAALANLVPVIMAAAASNRDRLNWFLAAGIGSKNVNISLTERLAAVDIRSDRERQIESDAKAGAGLGSEADALVEELMEIGRQDGYLSTHPGGKFNERCQHIRAREIGEILNRLGGLELMQAAGYRVIDGLGRVKGRVLEGAWDSIGGWRS